MKNLFVQFLILTFTVNLTKAQSYQRYSSGPTDNDFKWPEGKKMGLSLTFDDACLSQIDKGIPLLDKYKVKATFYLSPDNMVQKIYATGTPTIV
ncbi:MAG TPA: polysaccharide deacetylase family protein, partial [Draconibacterium sp.]|nr:polysaccharide deacetylase family protein [Draconibacterium sp.]